MKLTQKGTLFRLILGLEYTRIQNVSDIIQAVCFILLNKILLNEGTD